MLVLASAVQAREVVLQLPWDHQFQFAGYYAADLKGYYTDAGLSVTIKPAITPEQDFLEPPTEVMAGRADFGIGSGDIILANEKANRLRVIASIFQSSATRFYVRQSRQFNSLGALVENATIARRLNSFVDVELQAMLRSEGIDPDQVKTVKALPGVAHFVDSRVDMIGGYALTFPYEIRKYGIATTEINPQNYGVNFYGDSLFTRKELIDTEPELVEKFLQASLNGWVYALDHPQELIDYISTHLPRTHPVRDLRAFNSFQAERINQFTSYPIVQPGHINPYRWGRMHQALRDAGLITSEFDANRLIWTPALAKEEASRNFQKIASIVLAVSLSVALLLASIVLLLRKLVRERTASLLKANEDALQRQAEFESVFHSITDAMVLTDTNRRIFRTNKAFNTLFGYRFEQVKGQTTKLLYASQDKYQEQGTKRYSPAAPSGPSVYEMEYRRKDGTTFCGETLGVKVESKTGTLIGYLGVIRDISERLERERTIKNLSRFPDENPGPVLRSDIEGRIRYANQASTTLLDMWEDHGVSRLPAALCTTLKDARRDQQSKTVQINCGEQTFSFVVTPVADEDYLNLYGQDITESTLMEQQLRQSEKMQAIGQLAGGIAHDFNNQLSVILGSAELLGRKLDGNKLVRFVENIKSGALRAADLTQKLLAFSRKGSYNPRPVDLRHIISEVITLLEHSIDKRISLHQDLKVARNTVIGDPALLQNALLNLALNARDAMPEGGQIRFETDHVYLGAEECSRFTEPLKPGQYLRLSVADNGSGMDEETQKHIFEPFFTTKGEGKGSGLGLASVYGTVKSHSGAIQVRSQPGQGTRIRIYLPLAEQGVKTTEVLTEELDERSVNGDSRILVIDDESDFREMITEMLAGLGYTVNSFGDSRDAVTHYHDSWRDYDLVILDMIMPQMNGRDTFLALKQINPEVRVILSTGFSNDSDLQQMLDLGLSAFLGKPYQEQELSEKVAAVLRT